MLLLALPVAGLVAAPGPVDSMVDEPGPDRSAGGSNPVAGPAPDGLDDLMPARGHPHGAEATRFPGLGSSLQPDLLEWDHVEETAHRGFPECPPSLPACPWTDGARWFKWGHEATMQELVAASHELMDAGADPAVWAPDAYPGYQAAGEEAQRAAWLDWWLLVARAQSGSVTPFSPAALPMDAGDDQQGSGYGGDNGDEQEEDVPAVGKPRNLMSLWRLQAHGVPMAVHPWGASGHLVITDLGAFHFASWDEPADWMVQFERPLRGWAPVGKSLVVEGEEEDSGLLVVEYPDRWGFGEWDTIAAIDLSDGSVAYSGFMGLHAARSWALSGDGTPQILVVDQQGVLSRVDLRDGSEDRLVDAASEQGVVATALSLSSPSQIHSVALADATSDSVQDLYIVRSYEDGGISINGQSTPDSRVVSLYDGTDGSLVWESVAELQAENPLILPGEAIVGDLDGDGREDLVFNEFRYSWNTDSFFPRVITGVAAADGSVLFHDKGSVDCVVHEPPLDQVCIEEDYQPVAVLAQGGAPGRLVGLEGALFERPTGLVVRSMPEVPGLASQWEAGSPVDLPAPNWYDFEGAVYGSVGPDGEPQVLVTPFSRADRGHRMMNMQPGVSTKVYQVGMASVQEHALDDDLTNLFLNPETGEFTGWLYTQDRLVPLDDAYAPAGSGQRLLLSVSPMMWHDVDGDDVPDMLTRKTSGYLWLSGQDGSPIRDVDLEPGWNYRAVGQDDDGRVTMLGLQGGNYTYGGLEADEPDWSFPEELLEDGSVRGIADFTGDGRMELLVHHYAVYMEMEEPDGPSQPPEEEEPEKWQVFSPHSKKWLWEVQDEELYGVVWYDDLLPEREGAELLMIYGDRYDDEESTTLRLQVVGEKSPRWTWDLGEQMVEGLFEGYIVLLTQDEDEQDGERAYTVDVHRTEDRSRVNRLEFDEERPLVGFSLIALDDSDVHVVYSYGTKIADAKEDDPQAQQRVRVTRAEGGQASVDFATKDEGFDVEEDHDGDERLVISGSLSHFMGSPGDWSGSGLDDLVLMENDHAVVRSSTTGTILAVVPNDGWLQTRVDLNDDDRDEIGLYDYQKQQLRMYAYDGNAGELPEEDGTGGRVQLAGDGNHSRNMERFFEDEKTPAPAGIVLVVVLAGLLAARRLRAYRD